MTEVIITALYICNSFIQKYTIPIDSNNPKAMPYITSDMINTPIRNNINSVKLVVGNLLSIFSPN